MNQFRKIATIISSMQTGLVLLGLLSIIAALGSIILPEFYFHTRLFKVLLGLLFLNMVLCTINQIKSHIARSRKGLAFKSVWLRQTGAVMLHLGIVMVLVGGSVNTYFGQSAKISILEGDTVDVSSFLKTSTPVKLELKQFNIEFNPDGTPSQYYSYLNVFQDDRLVGVYSVNVNHPLNYQGIKAYQESFGSLIKIEGDFAGGTKVNEVFQEGDLLTIPGSTRQVKIYRYVPDFDPSIGMESKSLRPDNPQLIFSVYEQGQLLGVGTTAPGKRVEISQGNYITFTGVNPFTVLKLKTDPGMPIAAAGGICLMIGVCMALFPSPVGQKRKNAA